MKFEDVTLENDEYSLAVTIDGEPEYENRHVYLFRYDVARDGEGCLDAGTVYIVKSPWSIAEVEFVHVVGDNDADFVASTPEVPAGVLIEGALRMIAKHLVRGWREYLATRKKAKGKRIK